MDTHCSMRRRLYMAIKEKKLQISGMTCASCATRIEKGLSKIDGVEKANVNLALETGTVVYDGESVDSHAFKEKIEKLGYGVIEEKVEFDVVGMTCSACANRIEKRLNKIDGVDQANVNFALETVTVSYNQSETDPDEMK